MLDLGDVRLPLIGRVKKLLPGENTVMVAVASFIGIMAGIGNIVFRTVTEFVHESIFVPGHEIVSRGGLWTFLLPLIPVCGMILLMPLSILFPGEVNGYGFPKFLRKVNLEGGIVRFRTIVLKIVSCALTIGTGGSAGVEGPIAQVGGAIGSQVGQFFRVSGDRMKVYIAAGAAGAVGAVFNAPIAGIFFASEIVLLGTYDLSSFSALVISSALATVVSRAYYGQVPVFPIPDYQLVNSFVEIPLYMFMGVIVGIIAVLHIRVFYSVRDFYADLRLHPLIKPLTGALVVGCIGIVFPQVMGDGYDYMETILTGGGALHILVALVFLKIIATAVTLGSGGAGGVFAPGLFIGAMIGGAFGSVVHSLWPELTATPGAYAAVGIGAFLAAATHAPMTAIFLLFEMTGNYLIIIPVLLASTIGTVVARRLDEDSIDTVDFSREGIDIHEGREMAVLKSIKVGAVVSEDVDFISERANIDQLLTIFQMANSFYFPVIDESGTMTGVVSLQDVKGLLNDEKLRHDRKVGDICTRDVIFLALDDNLHTAMQMFDLKGLDEIPVVESADSRWVVGMLKRRDAIAAYNREIVKRGIVSRTALPVR